MALSAQHVAELRYRRALAASYGRRRKPRKMPEQRWPRAARAAYFVAIKSVFDDLRNELNRLLIPELPRLLALVAADKPQVLRADAMQVRLDSTDELKKELEKISDIADNVAGQTRVQQLAKKAAEQVALFNKQELNRLFESALGIELLHNEPYLRQQLELFTEDNVRLIRSLASDHLNQVSGIVMRAARAGTRVEDVAKDIIARFDVTESKAELLARDQVGKLNGELTQLRQSSVGVTEYEWSTSRDERVRTRHVELEGTKHRWDEPPIVDYKSGRRAHPGLDFQCRCVAIPMVDDLLEALALDEPSGPPAPRTPRPSRPPSVRVPAVREPAE